MHIEFIRPEQTHPLRKAILRSGFKDPDLVYPGDDAQDTFHLGAFKSGQIVAIASFYKQKHSTLSGWIQYRLRGMATDRDLQRRGIGKSLIIFGMDHLKSQQADIVWCNARVKASGFYERMGFSIRGEPFDIPGIGQHFVMFRKVLVPQNS